MVYGEKECLISFNFSPKKVRHPASSVVNGERNAPLHCDSSPLCGMQILTEERSLTSGAWFGG